MEVMKMKSHEWASYPGDLVMASTFDKLRTRAEAAEAKCAEYRNTFTATNEMRLSEVRLRHAVQQRAELAELHCTEALDRLEVANAQLAAANERVAVVEKERDGLREALSYLHERLTEYKNGEAMIYADARGDIAVIEKALAQPSAEVGE